MTIIQETNDAYHSNKTHIGSTSVKKVISSSVAHWFGDEFRTSPSMEIGSATHAMYGEPEKNLVINSGLETRRGNAWKDQEAALKPDQILMTEGNYYRARAMTEALHNNDQMADLWTQNGWVREASIYVDCPESGMPLKVKSDGYNERLKTMVDLKTCVSASPRDWQSSYGPFYKYNYNLQACFYMHCAALQNIQIDKFLIFAVENTPHHATQVYAISRQTIEAARPQMFAALQQIKQAKETGVYTTGWDAVTIL